MKKMWLSLVVILFFCPLLLATEFVFVNMVGEAFCVAPEKCYDLDRQRSVGIGSIGFFNTKDGESSCTITLEGNEYTLLLSERDETPWCFVVSCADNVLSVLFTKKPVEMKQEVFDALVEDAELEAIASNKEADGDSDDA